MHQSRGTELVEVYMLQLIEGNFLGNEEQNRVTEQIPPITYLGEEEPTSPPH